MSPSLVTHAAAHGGGISAVTNSSVNITGNTTFTLVTQLYRKGGGGVHAVANSSVDISGNTIFTGNLVWGLWRRGLFSDKQQCRYPW